MPLIRPFQKQLTRIFRWIVHLPVIGRLFGKKPAFQGQRRGSKRRRQNLALFLAVFITAAMAVLWVANKRAKSESVETADSSMKSDTYARLIAEGRPAEIIRYVDGLSGDTSLPLPVRSERLKQEIALTQRILKASGDDEYLAYAISRNLEAQFSLMRLYFRNDLIDHIDPEPLRALAGTLLESEDREISKLARLSMAYADMTRLATATEENRDRLLAQAERSFESAAGLDADDISMPNQLANYVSDLYRTGQGKTLAPSLLRKICELYGSSEKPQIQKIVATLNKQLFELKYHLSGQTQELMQFANDVANKNMAKVEKLIGSFDGSSMPDPRDYLEILNCILLVAQAGDAETASRLIAEAEPVFQSSTAPDSRKVLYEETRKIINHFDRRIEFPNLTDADGNPSTLLTESRAAVSLVILAQPGAVAANELKVREFGKMSEDLVESGQLRLVVVFLDNGQGESDWQSLAETVKETAGCRLLRSSATGTAAFLDAFPVRWSPSWIVLDDEGRMLRFNSPLQILESQLVDLLQISAIDAE